MTLSFRELLCFVVVFTELCTIYVPSFVLFCLIVIGVRSLDQVK